MAKALIIDDDTQSVKALTLLLGDFGFETCTASNGREGLEKLTQEDPDIILCDYDMPNMNGFEFTREVETNEQYSEHLLTPIIGIGDFPRDQRVYLNQHTGKNARKITEAIMKYFPKLPL